MPSQPYQTAAELRQRVEHEAGDFFDDNQAKRFDRLLERLEEETRGQIETLTGNVPFNEELGRVDEKRATDDAALLMPYPVRDVTEVETKHTLGDEWETLDADRYDWSEHRLILRHESRRGSRQTTGITADATRATWGDYYAKLRVTYDRGWDPIPADVLSVQVELVNKHLRNLRTEQTVAAMSPDEYEGVNNATALLTEDNMRRINAITNQSGKTLSV